MSEKVNKRDLYRTVRQVSEPKRGRVTKETVQKLSRHSSTSRAADIARKYAG